MAISYVTKLVLVVVIASFYFGYGVAGLNSSLDEISVNLGWCSIQETANLKACGDVEKWGPYVYYRSAISCILSFGAAIGAFSAGSLAPRYGRRKLLIYTDIVALVASTLCATPPAGYPITGLVLLLSGRLLTGICVGFIAVLVPLYISESTPKNKRGMYSVLHQILVTFGIFSAVILGLGLKLDRPDESDLKSYEQLSNFQELWWRLMQVMAAIPLALQIYFLAFVYTHETPTQDIADNKPALALETLKKIYGDNEEEAREAYEEIMTSRAAQEKNSVKSISVFASLKSNYYRPALLIGLGLAIFQQLSGINMLMSNSDNIFQKAGLTGWYTTVASSVLTFINMLMTFPAAPLIEKLGRKTLLLISFIGQTVSLLVVFAAALAGGGDGDNWSPYVIVTGFVVYILFFAIGAGPVVWVYISEIFPVENRTAAMGFCTLSNWVFSGLTIPLNFVLKDVTLYSVLVLCNACGVVFIVWFVKETAGTSIVDCPLYNNKKKSQSGDDLVDTKDKSQSGDDLVDTKDTEDNMPEETEQTAESA